MPITFHIPADLRKLARGRKAIIGNGVQLTVGDALESLWGLHPALRDRIMDEQGQVRPRINIFVGNECIHHTGGLGTLMPASAEVFILPALPCFTSEQ